RARGPRPPRDRTTRGAARVRRRTIWRWRLLRAEKGTLAQMIDDVLPDETQTELHRAAVGGGRDGADRDVRDVEVRRAEVHVIQQVEHLPAEFEPCLVDGDALAQ